jgi:hypothetical protein
MEGALDFCNMIQYKNMRENILREGVDEKANNMVIPCNPSVIGGIGDSNLLLVGIVCLDELSRRQIGALKDPYDPCTRRVGRTCACQ